MRRISNYFKTRWEKHEKGDHLVQVLGTVVVAVVVLLLFRNWLVPMFNNTLSNTETKINTMFSTDGGGADTPDEPTEPTE